jgi:hypothetical protein
MTPWEQRAGRRVEATGMHLQARYARLAISRQWGPLDSPTRAVAEDEGSDVADTTGQSWSHIDRGPHDMRLGAPDRAVKERPGARVRRDGG